MPTQVITDTNCKSTLKRIFCNTTEPLRSQIVDALCYIFSNTAIDCEDFAECEHLTTLSDFTVEDNTVCITYVDEHGGEFQRCFTMEQGEITITANNGLTKDTPTNVQLGGDLIKDTTITANGFTLIESGLTLLPDGRINFNQYLNTDFIGTVDYLIGIDSTTGTLYKTTLPDGATITADNGIHMSTDTNVQLGGTLLHDTTINTDIYTLFLTSAFSKTLDVSSSVANAIQAHGSSLSPTIYSLNIGTTSAGPALALLSQADATTGIQQLATITAGSNGTAAIGLGGSLDYQVQTANGLLRISNSIASKWVDVADLTRTSQYEIWGTNSSVSNRVASFYATGVVGIGNFSSYNSTRLDVVDNGLASSAKMANFSSSSGNSGTLVSVTGSGSMAGVVVATSNAAAVYATTNNADSVTGISTGAGGGNFTGLAYGATGQSVSLPLWAISTSPSSTTISQGIAINRFPTSGVGGVGLGSSIQWNLPNSGSSTVKAGDQYIKWLDPTASSETAVWELRLISGGIAASTVISIDGAGNITLPRSLQNFANDAAAAIGLIPVNGLYRNGSVVQIRVS